MQYFQTRPLRILVLATSMIASFGFSLSAASETVPVNGELLLKKWATPFPASKTVQPVGMRVDGIDFLIEGASGSDEPRIQAFAKSNPLGVLRFEDQNVFLDVSKQAGSPMRIFIGSISEEDLREIARIENSEVQLVPTLLRERLKTKFPNGYNTFAFKISLNQELTIRTREEFGMQWKVWPWSQIAKEEPRSQFFRNRIEVLDLVLPDKTQVTFKQSLPQISYHSEPAVFIDQRRGFDFYPEMRPLSLKVSSRCNSLLTSIFSRMKPRNRP